MISDKKLLEAVQVLTDYCRTQRGCQNCILRAYGASEWDCSISTFELREVLENIAARKRHHGYLI